MCRFFYHLTLCYAHEMSSGPLKSSAILVPYFLLLVVLSCVRSPTPPTETENRRLPQRDPIPIQLTGDWSDSEREYSSAAVYKDQIVLVPQYPDRIGNRIAMFPIKHLLVSNMQDKKYTPRAIHLDDDGLSRSIEGFEGFEAITFRGKDVFVTIESHHSTGMMGYLVRGRMISSNSIPSIKLDAASRIELPPRAALSNMTDEAIVMLPNGHLLTFYEANGVNVARNPVAYRFDIRGNGIKRLANVPIPNIEYRITDCSPADRNGRFWCINYMFPGDETKLKPGQDAFAQRWGVDPSQSDAWKANNKVVERLVELRFDGAVVRPCENPPIYLKLPDDGLPRNWEGLAFVRGRGFFIVTDKFPKTIFAFVPQ